MRSSANERMYCYLDGAPQWCGKDGDYVDDNGDVDDADPEEYYVRVDEDGDGVKGVINHYANDKSFFWNEEGRYVFYNSIQVSSR